MLVKELCKQCYNTHRSRPWEEHRRRDKETGEVYVVKDRTWSRGIMFCVACMDTRQRKTQIKVAACPPDCCYYLVAQLMKSAELEKTDD